MQSMNFCHVTDGGFILQTDWKVKNQILSKLKWVGDMNLRKYLQPKTTKLLWSHRLVPKVFSDIFTVMSLITPDDPVTGGMQTWDLLSVNSVMLQAQQILLEVGKDLIQKATNTPRVQKRLAWAAVQAAQSVSVMWFSGWWQRYVLLCATPLCYRYGQSVPYYCASLHLGPNTALIIRATFLLQGGMSLETSDGDPGNNHAAKLRYPVVLKCHIFLYQCSVAAADVSALRWWWLRSD